MKLSWTRVYPYPRSAVWLAVTDARAIRQWWVDTNFEPVKGKVFFMQDTPQGSWDGRVTGEVLDVEHETRVVFSWKGGGHQTKVTYELFDEPGGRTRFVLRHDGFVGLKGLFLSTLLRFGWRSFLNVQLAELAAHVATAGVAAPFPQPSKAQRGAAR
ncbi:MAG: SRPBCC domain-containing protein [Myxococcaceae bacterium]|nr:SRPBCC domain-containing protein [Myxococcaceae bacterium]